MDPFKRQVLSFAVIFLIIQIAFEMLSGAPLSIGLIVSRLITTVLATAIYAVVLRWLEKRKKTGK